MITHKVSPTKTDFFSHAPVVSYGSLQMVGLKLAMHRADKRVVNQQHIVSKHLNCLTRARGEPCPGRIYGSTEGMSSYRYTHTYTYTYTHTPTHPHTHTQTHTHRRRHTHAHTHTAD